MTPVFSSDIERPTLDTALKFTADDLARNRAGRLSDSQTARLQMTWRLMRTVVIVGLLAVGLFATVFLYFGGETGNLSLTIVGVGLTLLNAAIMGVGANRYLRIQRDLREGVVGVLEGTLRHTIRINRSAKTYILDVGGERLVVPRDLFNAFEEGAPYRLYRAPYTKILFSAERV
ncbi:MAG: hypothetical protein SGJ24_10075 [Chloroflexota bacterium]|nr:hypothetical protein [Chloroflexota bacterium]